MNEKAENRNRPRTIYALRCKANGKVYIGQTGDVWRRVQAHFQEIGRVNRWIKDHPNQGFGIGWYSYSDDAVKYGKDGFEIWILEENIPPEKAADREAHFINLYSSDDPDYGYNKTKAKHPRIIEAKYGLPPNPSKEHFKDDELLREEG